MSKALVQPCLIRSRIRSAYDVDTFTWLLACLILKEILCILCFTLFFLVHIYTIGLKKKNPGFYFFLFSLLSCILVYPKEVQQQDTYKITEIKKGYYIGKNRGSKILIQTDLDLSFQDEVKVKHIEPIHTDDNFTLFSFYSIQ